MTTKYFQDSLEEFIRHDCLLKPFSVTLCFDVSTKSCGRMHPLVQFAPG
jgi:hypothetical protein